MTEYRKVGRGPGGDEGIRRQAELLAAARHPGVVEVVGVEGSTERPVLVTALVDGPTLAAPMPLTAQEVAGLVAAVAATLADLHEMGIVHGAVVPEHVLVGTGGRPVLCGFGSAGRIGEPGPCGDDELQPATDVAALGRLLRRLATGPDARALRRVAETATADDPAARPSAREMAAEVAAAVPGSRLPSRPLPAGGSHDPAPDLRSLVAGARPDRRRRGIRRRRSSRAVVGDASRTGAAGAASGVRRDVAGLPGILGTKTAEPGDGQGGEAGPGGPAPGDGEGGGAGPGPGGGGDGVGTGARTMVAAPDRPALPLPPALRRHLHLPVRSGALAGAVVAVVAVGLLLLAPWASPGRPDPLPVPSAVAPATRPSPTSTSVAPPSSTLPTVRAGCPAPTSVLVADVDGDGCLDALDYADGVLEAAGVRWALGQAGDQIAIGNWSCRGTRTLVLLRPSTGDVFRFEGWAMGVDAPLVASAVATVAGGTNVRAADVDRDGCHELVVERGELPPQVVRLPGARP